MVLMIDNYDSFTYNLVQYIGEIGHKIVVYRNDKITVDDITQLGADHIVISPGPCTPNEAGISMSIVNNFKNIIPILGVCLGHQSIAQACGSNIVKARRIMHGKTSLVHHDGSFLYENIPSPFRATRYHSLVVEPKSVAKNMCINSWTENEKGEFDDIMGLSFESEKIFGVQFHPESIESEYGHTMLQNFLNSKI